MRIRHGKLIPRDDGKRKARRRKAPNLIRIEVAHRNGGRLEAFVHRSARRFLGTLKLSGRELSISLVTDRAIRALNRRWRNEDRATDVLSFPAGESPRGAPGPTPLGDVVISLDTAVREARRRGRTVEDEVALYLAHGLLHLLGYDHERRADARKMAAMEERLLGRAGMIAASGVFDR